LSRIDRMPFPRRHLPRWIPDSLDYWIRNGGELESMIAYVEANPEAAGLKNWPWSSRPVRQAILSPVRE